MSSSFQWHTSDGTLMFMRLWNPQISDRLAAVCLIHGLGEHSGRYERVASHLMNHGFAVMAPDLRGHGKSDGKRGHIDRYETFMQDIDSCIERVRQRFAGLPAFLYGHSMGGNLVLNYALRRTPDLAGVIATSPWLRLAFSPARSRLLLARAMSILWPSFTSDNGLRSSSMTRDSDVTRQYDDDPLVHRAITARLFTEIEQSGSWALEHADQLRLPLLIMHGTADQVTSCQASQEFASLVGGSGRPDSKQSSVRSSKPDDLVKATTSTFGAWDGLYHELHNEPDGEKVLDAICEWMKQQIRTRASKSQYRSSGPMED